MKPLIGRISEQDLDRLFSGKAPAAGTGLEDLRGLVRKVQASFTAGIEPALESRHLTALMQLVNLTDKGDLAVRPASKVPGPGVRASGLPKTRRRFMLASLFGTLAAKLTAAGVATAMIAGGAAATGRLPGGAQTGVSKAVEKIGLHIPGGDTPETALEKAEDAGDGATAGKPVTPTDTDTGLETGTYGKPANQPNANAAFGQSVASDARDGGVDGQQISQAARARAQERRSGKLESRPENAGPDAVPPAGAGKPGDAGSPAQTGLERAGNTPAASHLPSTVPAGKPAGAGGARP